MTYLDRPDVRVVPGRRRAADPVPYLARARGGRRATSCTSRRWSVAESRVPAGQALSLSLEDHSLVVAFFYTDGRAVAEAPSFEPGDRVRVTGIAGQFDREAPYRESYQVYPRSAADVAHAGIPAHAYRWGALGALAAPARDAGVGGAAAPAGAGGASPNCATPRTATAGSSNSRATRSSSTTSPGNASSSTRPRGARSAWRRTPPRRRSATSSPRRHGRRARPLRSASGGRHGALGLPRRRAGRPARLYEFESQLIDLGGGTRVLSLARDVDARRDFERGLIEARRGGGAAPRRRPARRPRRRRASRAPFWPHEPRDPHAADGRARLRRDPARRRPGRASSTSSRASRTAGAACSSTLNSVLDLARLDAGGEMLRPVALDLAAHLASSVTLLRPGAEAKGLASTSTPATRSRPARRRRVRPRSLTNLVGNAVKFTDAGGRHGRAPRPSGSDAVLTVADTGIGMRRRVPADAVLRVPAGVRGPRPHPRGHRPRPGHHAAPGRR